MSRTCRTMSESFAVVAYLVSLVIISTRDVLLNVSAD